MNSGVLSKGKVIQVSGPVVDVKFDSGHLPKLRDALKVTVDDNELTMEVAQMLGEGVVRCIVLEIWKSHKPVPVLRFQSEAQPSEECLMYLVNRLMEGRRYLNLRKDGIFTDLRLVLKNRMYLLKSLKQESR